MMIVEGAFSCSSQNKLKRDSKCGNRDVRRAINGDGVKAFFDDFHFFLYLVQ